MRIVWFRRDLRLTDNAALAAALRTSGAILPVHVLPAGSGESSTASGSWRRASIAALDAALTDRGNRLRLLVGDAPTILARLAGALRAEGVHCTRDWTPGGLAEESAVRDALATLRCPLHVAEGQLLVTPEAVRTRDGDPYRVFTPFHRAWSLAWRSAPPLPAPARIPAPESVPAQAGEPPGPDVPAPSAADSSLLASWRPGEAGAAARLREFSRHSIRDYARARDVPALRGTSELSAHISFGEISPNQIVDALQAWPEETTGPFVRQLAWREFAYHVLYHFPHTQAAPLREEFAAFPWRDDEAALEAWRSGLTGYPLVDAGMRQLASTGWMHNRVRLVCGSFLTKHLLMPWQTGEAYFRERLIDFDTASNVFNWQWVAGSGADAAPYFRIFSPVSQGMRFDADGDYVRRWVPELSALTGASAHQPWRTRARESAAGDVTAGMTYPMRIVDHAEARQRALAAHAAIRHTRS